MSNKTDQPRLIYTSYNYCPICGFKYSKEDYNKKDAVYHCPKCKFRFYQNMDPTISVVIPKAGEPNLVLMAKRNQNPGKGKYDLPGGFLDIGETPEQACIREVKEELGITIKPVQLMDIFLTDYEYHGLLYKHTTIYYITEPIDKPPAIKDKNENSSCAFFDVREFDNFKDNMAFSSDKQAVEKYSKSYLK